jgi:hypothetical protein
MKTHHWLGLGALVLATACGGGPGNFSGRVDGNPLTVRSAALMKVPDTVPGNIGGYTVAVVLSDQNNVCQLLQNNEVVRDSAEFGFLAGTTNASGKWSAQVSAGTFNVEDVITLFDQSSLMSQNVAYALYEQLDSNCNPTSPGLSNWGTGGSITFNALDAVAGGSAQGSYSVTFGSGDQATGNFHANFCSTTTNPVLTFATGGGPSQPKPACL